MSTIAAVIGEDTVSGDIQEWNIWLEAFKVGRFEILLKNLANKWGGDFHSNDDVTITPEAVDLLKGYVDDVIPHLDKRGVYTNIIKVVGRDYARDLARLLYSGKYGSVEADDVLDDLLLQTGSEITYTPPDPPEAPVVGINRSRYYLVDWFKDIGKRINWDAYVDLTKALHFFAAGAVAEESGVTLKALADDMGNNILDLQKGEEIGFSIVNHVEFSAGSLEDHYTDMNAADFSKGLNTLCVNDGVGVATDKIAGMSSIKFYCTVGAYLEIWLDFTSGLYSRTGLDLSKPDEMSYYTWHNGSPATFDIRPRLEDVDGNVIEFSRVDMFGGEWRKGRTWQVHTTYDKAWKVFVPIGDSNENEVQDSVTDCKWYYITKNTTFDWSDVKKLGFKNFTASIGAANAWIDKLCIPSLEVISIDSDATSIAAYGKSMFFDRRDDIRSQIELDVQTADYLAKHKDPLSTIRIIASLQTGSKYTGQSVDVHAPGHGIATATKYRIMKLHHRGSLKPILKGRKAITTYDLLKHTINPTQVIDPLRFNLLHDPMATTVELLLEAKRRSSGSVSTQNMIEFGDTHPIPDPILFDDPDTPSGFDASDITTGVAISDEGVSYVYFVVTIPVVIEGSGYVLQYKKTLETDWHTRVLIGTNVIRIEPVEPNTEYQFRVATAGSLLSTLSPYTSIVTKTSAKKTGTPTTPTGGSSTNMVGGILLKWDRVADADIKFYNIYHNTVNNPGTATFLTDVDISWFFYQSEDYGNTHYFWITAEDYSGNESAKSTVISGTPIKVQTVDLTDQLITTAKIANLAVEEGKLASGAATEAKIAAGAVTETKIGTNAVSSPKIVAGAILAGKIAAGAVETEKLAAGSVVAIKIGAGEVTTAKLDALAVTSDKIDANAIIAGKIDAGAVTTNKLDALAVTAAKLAAGSVETAKIDAGAVTADKITVATLSAIKADLGTITAGSITGVVISQASGSVLINSSGIKVKGQYCKFYDTGDAYRGLVYGSTSGHLYIAANDHVYVTPLAIQTYSHIRLDSPITTVNMGMYPSLAATDTRGVDLGSASLYFRDINYKAAYDRGCIVVCDALDDVAIIKNIVPSGKVSERMGLPIYDYKSFPRWIADIPSERGEKGDDGLNLSALVSLLIGVNRKLIIRIETIEEKMVNN